jgi:hypothetical protein
MTEGPRPPAQIEPIVRALGVDDAVTYLMAFGGAELYLAKTPGARSRVVELLGRDKAEALALAAEDAPYWPRRVPLAKQWLAGVLRAKGLPNAEIARKLRVSEETVRRLLAAEPKAALQDDPRQPRLL